MRTQRIFARLCLALLVLSTGLCVQAQSFTADDGSKLKAAPRPVQRSTSTSSSARTASAAALVCAPNATGCEGIPVTYTAPMLATPATPLTTTLAAGNNHRGNMFNLEATNTVVINSFEAHPMGNTTIEIYYKTGTYSGFENNPGAWTLIGSAAVTAQPYGTATPVPVDVNITIHAGQTYAFYITSNTQAVSLNYSNGSSEGAVFASDANLKFFEGVGVEYPFTQNTGAVYRPRIWNGKINYSAATVLPAAPATGSLTTTLAGGNNHRGSMFNVQATSSLTITSFDAHPMANTTIEIYYKTGSYSGFENNPGAWTFLGSAAVTAQPYGTATPVPVPVNISIPAGQTYAFYITSNSTAVSLNYTNGTSEGAVYASDANLKFFEGVGVEYPFTSGTGSIFRPRIWNGKIHYRTAGLVQTAGLPSGSVFPVGTTVNTFEYGGEAGVSACSFQVTVSATPTLDDVSDATVCAGTASSAIAFSGGADSYQWTNSNPAIGLAASGTGNLPSFMPVNGSGSAVTASITVTPYNGTCAGTPKSFTLTVKPAPAALSASISDQSLLAGSATAPVALPGSGVTYSWTNSNPSIGLTASGTGDIPSVATTNSGSVAQVASVTVTPMADGCPSPSTSFSITVHPLLLVCAPDVRTCAGNPVTYATPQVILPATNALTATFGAGNNHRGNMFNVQAINPLTITSFDAHPMGNTTIEIYYKTGSYSGFENNPGAWTLIGSAAVTAQPFGTPTPVPVPVNLTIPAGETYAFYITSNTPAVSLNYSNGSSEGAVYSADANLKFFEGVGLEYPFTQNTGAIYRPRIWNGRIHYSLFAVPAVLQTAGLPSGSVFPAGSTTNTFQITNGAATTSCSSVVTVNEAAGGDSLVNLGACAGTTVASVALTGTAGSYSWSNSNPSIGLAASGTGDLPSFTTVNGGTAADTALITVTPAPGPCAGDVRSFAIIVKPLPVFNPAGFSSTVCGGQGIAFPISNGGNTAGATYSWTNSNPAIGLAASGSSDIASFATANVDAAASISVTPSAGGCSGTPASFTLVVKPTPVVNAIANVVACAGTGTGGITVSGTPAAATFNWTNDNPAIGLPASGSGNIPGFVATNSTNAPITATVTVTPKLENVTYTVYSTHGGNGNTSQYGEYANSAADFDALFNTSNSNTTIFSSGTGDPELLLNFSDASLLTAAGISIPNGNEFFGLVVTSNFVAAETGLYTFGIDGDDGVDLSIDGAVVASYYGPHGFGGLHTGTVSLVAGTTYTLRVRMQEYGGGEGLLAVWQRPSQGSMTVQAGELVSCPGTPVSFTITVEPQAAASISYGGSTLCGATSLLPGITGTGGGVFSSTNGLSINPGTGAIDLGASTPGTYTVTYTVAGSGSSCSAVVASTSVLVQAPITHGQSNQAVCSGNPTSVTFPATPGTLFAWTNNNPAIGLPASGTGNIAPFAAINNGNSPITATINVMASGSAGVSALAGWSYVRGYEVVEHSGSDLNDYQLRMVINTQALIGAGQLDPSGKDLRFGNGNGDTLYNYWIESGLNTPNTVIWVKVDHIAALSMKPVSMYYGNPSATAMSALQGTFYGPHSATDSVQGGSTGGVPSSQRGFRFAPTEDILVASFGKNEPTGSNRYVTLFDFASQAKLSQLQVSGPAAQYSYGDLAQPLWLTQGTQYVLEIYQGESDGYYFGAAPQAGQHITFLDMRYCNGCDQNTFPSNALSGMHYGFVDLHYYTRTQATVAPTYSEAFSCPAGSFTITVNPTPAATISYGAGPYSTGSGTLPVTHSGTTGGTYTSSPAGLVADAGTGTIDLLASAPGSYTVTYTVAAAGGCAAYSTSAPVTLTFLATIAYPGSPYCGATGTATVTRNGTAGGTYSATPAGLSINAGTGAVDLAASAAGTYTVRYALSPTEFTTTQLAVRPSVLIDPQVNTVLCNGATFNALTLTGAPGLALSWSTDGTGIGMPASGGSSIPAFTATNNGSTVLSSFVYVQAAGGTGCSLKRMVFRITVNPTPVLSGPGSQQLCAGSPSTPLPFVSTVSGTLVSWSNNNTAIGLTASGTGTVPSFLAVNNSGALLLAQVTAIPTANGCTGAPYMVGLEVRPSAGTISYPQASYCSTGWAYVRNTGSTGGTYSATPAGLSLNAQSGAVSLAQSAAGTYTVSYSPAAGGGCGGAASTTIVVKPQATVNNLPNQVYCSGMVTAPVAFSGTAQSYSWINDNPSIGLAASGTGTSLPSFTTVNAGPGVQYAYIKVTPLGGANTCTGKAAAFRIAVNFCPPVTQAGGTAGDVSSQRSALMQQFQVGPNPARTQVQLTYTGPQEGPFTVQLVSQYGVPVGKLFSFSGTVFTMDLSNTTPGSYLLRVTQVKSGITFDKVVIKL